MARMSKELKIKIAAMREKYNKNKKTIVGETCFCPACDTQFTKTTYHQVFCRTRSHTQCKDQYYNTLLSEKKQANEAEYLEKRIIIDE